MSIDQKTRFFREIVKCGIKEVEIAYPSASDTDFKFVRNLIEDGEIPGDVWIQVSPSRVLALCDSFLPYSDTILFHRYLLQHEPT